MGRHIRSKRRQADRWGEDRSPGRAGDYHRLNSLSPLPKDLSGQVFLVGNVILGIPQHLKLRHPCCVLYDESARVYVVKGTALANILPHHRDQYVTLHPDGFNGLTKPTAFEKFVRDLPSRSLFREDCLGRLSEMDLYRIREALGRDVQ